MIHISKDPSGPIRKNVTFIPFRICGTVGLVTDHGDCQNVGVGVKGPTKIWHRAGVGNENTFYLSSKKRLCRRSLAMAMQVAEHWVALSSPMWGGR